MHNEAIIIIVTVLGNCGLLEAIAYWIRHVRD